MTTIRINESMTLGKSLLDYLKSLRGFDYIEFVKPKPKTYKFLPAETLTDEEIERIKKAEQSGICTDIGELKAYLKSQL